MIESQENNHVKEPRNKIFSNLFIIAGGWFLFAPSALLFYNFVLKPQSTIAKPWDQLVFLIGGFVLLFLGLGKIEKKSDLLLYSIIPLMGLLFSFLFNLVPKAWLITDAFAYSLMGTYLLVLFVFYYTKGYFESSDK